MDTHTAPLPPAQSAWFGLARKVPTHRGTVRIQLRWGRILALFGFVLLLGYFALSTVVFFMYRVAGYQDATFGDAMSVWWRQTEIRNRQGDRQIELAQELAKERRWSEAHNMLTEGVQRSPGNLEGRKLLAELRASYDPDSALALLADGIKYGQNDIDYLRFFMRLAVLQRDFERIMETANAILPPEPQITDRNLLVAFAGSQAAFNLGDLERMRELMDGYQLTGVADGVVLASNFLQRLGREEAAMEMLQAFAQRYRGAELDTVWQRLMEMHLQRKEHQRALDIALDRMVRLPMAYAPRVDLIRIYWETGRRQRVGPEVDRFIRQFRENGPAILSLAEFAVAAGDVETARRLYEVALENNHDLSLFGLLLIETYVQAGQYEQAIAFCDELEAEQPAWLTVHMPIFTGLRSLAHYGAAKDEMGRLYLNRLLQDGQAKTEVFSSIAATFREMGRPLPARQLLLEAYRRDDTDMGVLRQIIEAELDLAESRSVSRHISTMMERRQIQETFLQRLQAELTSDRFLFTPRRDELLEEVATSLAYIRAFEWEPSLTPPVIDTARSTAATATTP